MSHRRVSLAELTSPLFLASRTEHTAGVIARPLPEFDRRLPELRAGSDFREPEYRREVFLRFYEFHLRYRAHPGCVYYVMPWLRETLGWSEEQALWYAFLNGNTQHPPSSWLLFQNAETPRRAEQMLDWFHHPSVYPKLAFDTDRRHHKKVLAESVRHYTTWLDGRSQSRAIREVAKGGWPAMWKWASSLYSFGRLSAFSYLEYLRIMGIEFDCEDLMLEDREGSRSHRNGLCIVLGRDDLDWHASNPRFNGQYSETTLRWLRREAEGLLTDMRRRAIGQPWAYDVSYFTLESALCTYKSWHRVNRRYPNVYNDMLYDRLRNAERAWSGVSFELFWKARSDSLPVGLRLEDNPFDPGCVPVKQNHYRTTGQVIVMDHDWPCFSNDFASAVAAHAFGPRQR